MLMSIGLSSRSIIPPAPMLTSVTVSSPFCNAVIMPRGSSTDCEESDFWSLIVLVSPFSFSHQKISENGLEQERQIMKNYFFSSMNNNKLTAVGILLEQSRSLLDFLRLSNTPWNSELLSDQVISIWVFYKIIWTPDLYILVAAQRAVLRLIQKSFYFNMRFMNLSNSTLTAKYSQLKIIECWPTATTVPRKKFALCWNGGWGQTKPPRLKTVTHHFVLFFLKL